MRELDRTPSANKIWDAVLIEDRGFPLRSELFLFIPPNGEEIPLIYNDQTPFEVARLIAPSNQKCHGQWLSNKRYELTCEKGYLWKRFDHPEVRVDLKIAHPISYDDPSIQSQRMR
ncbi:hypothetical protein MAIT1_01615 [Magnetofaba australis IT-1]|uniref:Uncharacterized protein n=1 Tax=Magnetofaba australis IT-1 TaxID=1434232 RepID=A0A1Y2K0T2_9PROT|nr:hypothetical protein MAIT1_01615 [Magnetofaba australis IT-1]